MLTGLSHPYGITVMDQHLYWTDWGTLSVQRVHKVTLERTTIRSSLANLMDIKTWKEPDVILRFPFNNERVIYHHTELICIAELPQGLII